MKTPTETLEALQNSASQSGQSVMSSLGSNSNNNSSSSSISSSISSAVDSSSITDDGSNSTSMLGYLFYTIIIIIVLAIFGLNVFVYLAKGTQSTSDFIDNIFKIIDPFLGHFLSKIAKFISSIFIIGYETTLGGEAAAEASAGVVGAGLTAMKGPELSSSAVSQPHQQTQNEQTMTPQMQQHYDEQQQQQKQQQSYEPSTAETTTGWCYVGEDEGYRSCLEINPSTTSCASGQVFSSQQKCLKE